MSRRYSEEEVLAEVEALTRPRLVTWIEARIVQPEITPGGNRFRDVDLARLQTLCDLDDSYDLAPDALGMVMSLMDQMNAMRSEMEALMEALSAEPPEVRARIRTVIATRIPPRD